MAIKKDRLIDTTECAELLGLSPGTLRHWVCQRKITIVKVGRLTKFKISDVEKYIDDHTVQAYTDHEGKKKGEGEFHFLKDYSK